MTQNQHQRAIYKKKGARTAVVSRPNYSATAKSKKTTKKRPNKENRTWKSEYMHTRDRIIRSSTAVQVVRFLHWISEWLIWLKKELRLLINRNDTVKRKTEFSLIYHLNFFLDLFVLENGACMIVVHCRVHLLFNGECHQHSYTTGAYMW